MIQPEYLARLHRMYDAALALENGDEDAAIRLVSATADVIALGMPAYTSRRAAVRRALDRKEGGQ